MSLMYPYVVYGILHGVAKHRSLGLSGAVLAYPHIPLGILSYGR